MKRVKNIVKFIDHILSRKRYQVVLSITIVVFLTGISFLSSLDNDFTNWDDNSYITDNHLIKDFSQKNIKVIFTSFNLSNYHPLVLFSFLLEYHFFQLDPFFYHFTNFTLHIFNAVSLFLVIFLLCNKVSISFITALLFGIHPLHVESVAWVTERKDVLSTFFFLQSIIFYLIYRKKKGVFYYFLSIVTFIFSLLSKAMVVTLPVILILFDYLSYRKLDKRSLLEKVPFFMLSIIFGVLNILAQKSDGALVVEKSFAFTYNFLVASKSLVFYLVKIVIPFNLSALYPYPDAISILSPTYFFPPFLLLALTSLIFYSRKWTREIIFGSLFFFITILPVLKLIPVGNAFAADRYMYIPSIGLFFMIGLAFHRAYYLDGTFEKLRKASLGIFLCVLIFTFSVLTYQRNNIWQNSKTLWLNVLENYPESSTAHNNLGNVYLNQDKIAEAIEEYREALRINPKHAKAHIGLGNAYINQNKVGEAVEEFREALRLSPEDAKAHNNLGNAYNSQNRIGEAIEEFRYALTINPEYAEAHNNLGNVYLNQNKMTEAIEEFREASRINPELAGPHNNLANVYLNQDKIAEAIDEFQEALRLNPEFEDAHNGLGNVYFNQNRIGEAIEEFREAIRLNPKYAKAHYNLGVVYHNKNKIEEAIKEYKEAIRLNPEYAEVHYNLGNAYINQNKIAEAIEEYREAIRLNPGHAEAHYNLGVVYHNYGRIGKAIEKYRAALRFDPDYADAHFNLGNAYHNQNKVAEAIEEYKEVLRLNPGFVGAHFNLGLSYLKKGLREEAIREFKEVLKIEPDYNDALKILDKINSGS